MMAWVIISVSLPMETTSTGANKACPSRCSKNLGRLAAGPFMVVRYSLLGSTLAGVTRGWILDLRPMRNIRMVEGGKLDCWIIGLLDSWVTENLGGAVG